MLVPFVNTDRLLTQWANNEVANSECIKKATEEAWVVSRLDENDHLKQPIKSRYIQKIFNHLTTQKTIQKEQRLENTAWQLASHSNRVNLSVTINEDFYGFLKNIMLSIPLTNLGIQHKEINDFFAKVDQIIKDSEKLQVLMQLPDDIWSSIIEHILGNADVNSLKRISKQFDASIVKHTIKLINDKKLNLPEIGFYSINQITIFFKEKSSELKHISFLCRSGSPHQYSRIKYLQQKHKTERVRNK